METNGITLPGYRVNEYLVVLTPHEDLRIRVRTLKEEFTATYQVESAVNSTPRLALVHFFQYSMMEDRITNRLRNVALAQFPFKVELKDFGSFPSHCIFINVTTKLPLQQLIKTIRTESQRLMKLNSENKPHFIMEPHLTIARKLLPWQYEKGWLEFSNRHFRGSFIAEGMTLLRRPEGELKYHAVGKFEFQNLPVTTRQGELFG